MTNWDTHQQCPRHRACSRIAPCEVCKTWAPTQWDVTEAWLERHPLIQRAPAGQYLAESAEPVRKKKKAKKRRAADPQPALPPTGKKPKKKGKKLAGAKPQGDEHPSEAQFFAMMRLMADKHGWSIEGQARPTGPDALPSASPTAPLPASHTPAYTDPGMSHSSRAPAALGAPPGEESFPPMGPPPLPTQEREYVEPLSAFSESD